MTTLAPFAPSRAVALAGEYEFIVVAESGPDPDQAARGQLHLEPTDTLHRYYVNALGQQWRRHGDHPLMGWTSLTGKIGLTTAGTPLMSRDADLPGVATELDSLKSGLRLMLGYRPMFDGGYNELIVTRVRSEGFAGLWSSSLGYTTYSAKGYFCAVRTWKAFDS